MNRFEDTAVWDGQFFLCGGEFNHGKGGKAFRIFNAVEHDADLFAVCRQQGSCFDGRISRQYRQAALTCP